ncbi:unnamed protein product [Meloidogyne enterolobii]|uniref:Uncharacterized protein n=1 Tax=Meloidogyne enterolobii TaxID=390850 RepID=A0ACB1BAC8_MELEN
MFAYTFAKKYNAPAYYTFLGHLVMEAFDLSILLLFIRRENTCVIGKKRIPFVKLDQ